MSIVITVTTGMAISFVFFIALLQLTTELLAASSVRLYNSAAAEPFLNGSSSAYVEDMYNAWLRDPASVHAVSKE